MALRLGLGRIIEWAKNSDPEELAYAVVRLTAIAKERVAQMNSRAAGADAAAKVKRTRRTKAQLAIEQAESKHESGQQSVLGTSVGA